jgi:hypothetical protein
MTKKKNQKKKILLKINSGEAAFVAKIETLNHIASTYVSIANDSKSEQEKLRYHDIVNGIYEWSAKTYFNGEDGYDDDEE